MIYMRHTQKNNKKMVEFLNRFTKRTYVIRSAYGKHGLSVKYGEGISDITPLLSTKELYYVMLGITNLLEQEKKVLE